MTQLQQVFLLIVLILQSQTIFTDPIFDLFAQRSKGKQKKDDVGQNEIVRLRVLVHAFIIGEDLEVSDLLKVVQTQILNRTMPLCLPGFSSFGGACYFLSPLKSNWTAASSFCSMKRNASLVAFDTDEELNFVVEKLLKPKKVNQAFIGLYAREPGQWSWLDGRTFWDSIFGPLFYVYRPDTSRCGLINLVNRSQIAIEGRDCSTDEAHFLCKYVQDYCHGKHVCGRGGECLNMGSTYRCQCNFFYRGRQCENFSSKAIQSIIAVILIIFMAILACCYKLDFVSSSQSLEQFFNPQQTGRRGFQQRLMDSSLS